MNRRINALTWEQFRDRVPATCDLAIVPVGTIEAHGAIPLGTDTLIPEALAVDLAPRLNALIAPSIAYGVTNSLLPFPARRRSRPDFTAYLFEAASGLVDAGFRRIVLLNGHGGQTSEVASVVASLWNEKRLTPSRSNGGDSPRSFRPRSTRARSRAMRGSKRRR
jgi:creatinine amidohydrolase